MPQPPARFGLNVDPHAGGVVVATRIAKLADETEMDLIGIQDHPYMPDLLDTLGLITWLAARTSKVSFFPNVANLPLRHPALLAKQAATVDLLSGGRFVLGLGAGARAFFDGIAGMGGPQRSTTQARAALSEAIDIIKASWAGEPFAFEGEHYSTPAVEPGPKPARDIPLWLGVLGPRAAQLLGTKADGWSVSTTYMPPAKLAPLNQIIDDAAAQAGRDPTTIIRLYNVMGAISPSDTDAFNGPVERWVDTLTTLYARSGMDTFVFRPSGDRERQSHIFAEEIAPAVRDATRNL